MTDRNPDPEIARAQVCLRQGQIEAAFAIYRGLVAAFPGDPRLQRALAALDRGLGPGRAAPEPRPDQFDALVGMLNQGRFAETIAQANMLVLSHPGAVGLWSLLGVASAQSGRTDLAVIAFGRACHLNPAIPESQCNFGKALLDVGRLDDAAACYARAIALRPDFVSAYCDLGNVQAAQERFDDAAATYMQALSRNPGYAEAHNNLGNVRKAQGRFDEALASYRSALACNPHYYDALANLGNLLNSRGELEAAAESYRRALALQPGNAEIEVELLRLQQDFADWTAFDHLAATCARLAQQDAAPAPFNILPLADDAALQLAFSRKWAAERYRQAALPLPARPATRPDRLRIGYFSADFHDHATLFLMSGLLREHDRSRFELCAYSYGRQPKGALGEQARQHIDRFFDAAGLPSRALADLARSHALDIAIDLKGYTAGTRVDVFQYRLAPVQISYLGYPGTLATGFIDYIVADAVVIPEDLRACYTEKVIWLPHSYQPNDNTREIAPLQTRRADFGLPEHGFVFCCFNNTYKITPREFAIWMRLLGKVEGSVLWLYKANRWCEANLRKQAALRGIAPDRLVFAGRLEQSQHLARHRHADLFLDTFNVNAHTTASDALWAGLPVVTRAGQQLAARVSASLLTAVGLPDLITHSDADYEALIFDLATDPAKLAAIRARLATNRRTHPLFDTQGYTRDFETGLQRAFDRYLAGEAPCDIRIAPVGEQGRR